MKLYATITSERASKSQGGNKFINLIIVDDNREKVLSLHLVPYKDEIGEGLKAEITTADHVYVDIQGEQINETKRQKEEPYKGSQREMDDELFDSANAGEL